MLGTWFCPGRMPPAVRARYETQLKEKPGDARLENMLRAYDQALSHPDGTDLADARAFAPLCWPNKKELRHKGMAL